MPLVSGLFGSKRISSPSVTRSRPASSCALKTTISASRRTCREVSPTIHEKMGELPTTVVLICILSVSRCERGAQLLPNLACRVRYKSQLRPLLFLRQQVALPHRSKSTLWAQRKILERHVARSFLDALFQRGGVFELRQFAADEAEDNDFSARHQLERLKSS